MENISTGKNIKPGDKLIINGPLGNHAIAVLGARKNLSFSTSVEFRLCIFKSYDNECTAKLQRDQFYA